MDIHIRATAPGSRFNIVASIEGHQHGVLCCRGLSPDQQFLVKNAPTLEEGIYTFYDLEKSAEVSQTCVFAGITEALKHHSKGDVSKIQIIDLCSGMGGFTIGSQVLGLETKAFVERNHLACLALKANFDGDIIQGDLENDEILKRLHRLKQSCHLQITGGFSCQGYSRQGDMLGLDDHRSHTLQGILRYWSV